MRNRSFLKDLSAMIPLVLSGFLCIAIFFLLWEKSKSDPTFNATLQEVSTIFMAISGFLAAIIMVYMAWAATGMKQVRSSAIDSLSKVTQQMHNFRSIIELLMRSKIWMPGLKEYIDDEFAGLTFFDVKEFYKGKSKLAIEFLQESHNYQDTENLYLEMKSLLMTSLKEKQIPETIRYPKMYDKDLVAKWMEHKCSSGLWYFFGYKYGEFKDALDYNAVFERHQEKIMTLAHAIDSQAFEDSSFNEVFLTRLGEYINKEVLPQLVQIQSRTDRKMPSIMRYLYSIFLGVVLAGVLLPLLFILFNLSILWLAVSYSFVISVIFFIAISFYRFVMQEANS